MLPAHSGDQNITNRRLIIWRQRGGLFTERGQLAGVDQVQDRGLDQDCSGWVRSHQGGKVLGV
jgi:hypothetical protein